jgi:hypothetical protein
MSLPSHSDRDNGREPCVTTIALRSTTAAACRSSVVDARSVDVTSSYCLGRRRSGSGTGTVNAGRQSHGAGRRCSRVHHGEDFPLVELPLVRVEVMPNCI